VSEKGDPLLAWWRFGLGMSLAFTSDAKNRWAAEWLTWPDFAPFWAQCVRHVMRTSQLDGGRLQVARHEGTTRVTLELFDQQDAFINQADARLSVLGPADQDQRQEYVLQQLAPGTYTAEFASERPGAYHLDVISRLGEQLLFRQTLGTFVGYRDELRLRPVQTPLLRQVADRTGGLVDPTAEQLFSLAAPAGSGARAVPLWRWLVTASLLLWLLDVALRRLEWFGV
jgi:hypothetical protein